MKRLPIVLYLGIALVVAGLVSCEKEVKKIVEAPAAITVKAVNASADSVTQGLTVQLWTDLGFSANADSTNLKYNWYADKGTFDVSTGDTAVWNAPGEPSMVKISVHVTDGENIAIGTKTVGVDMYVPTADTFYVGVNTENSSLSCINCHDGGVGGDQYAGWSQTAHAHAWADLMANDHHGPSCIPCHTVQQDNTPGNSGFDEVPTAQFQDVQCESCHGPGSVHASGSAASPPRDPMKALEVETCGVCHTGGHHPFLEEWQASRHSQLDENAHAAGNAGCQPCHSGTGFVATYDPDESDLFNPDNPMDLTCGACHDSHSDDNPAQVRTMAEVDLVSGKTIAQGTGGAGQLCMQCHHARHSAEDEIPEGSAHFGPHHSNQTDALFGTSGNEAVNPNMTFASSGHNKIEGTCARCHVYAISNGEESTTGHTFEPKVEACAECHGTITDFDQIMAKKDYDNNGTVEGIQVEVNGLMQKLAETMVTYDNDHYASKYLGNPDPTSDDFIATVMDSVNNTYRDSTEAGAVKIREGGFNLFYEYEERSEGVHNPAYIVELLQQSILYYDPTALPSDVVLRSGQATTFTAIAANVK